MWVKGQHALSLPTIIIIIIVPACIASKQSVMIAGQTKYSTLGIMYTSEDVQCAGN